MSLVIDDPQSWMTTLLGWYGPHRNWTDEKLRPGDVCENGHIYKGQGVCQSAGGALVSIAQANAATYYGWKRSGLFVYQNGQAQTQIFREDRT